MFSNKLSGLFKKFLGQSDDDSLADSLVTRHGSSQHCLSINCRTADSGFTPTAGDFNCNISDKYQGELSMGGYSISTSSSDSTDCQEFGCPGCHRCLALRSSESAAYPVDTTTTTIISSSVTGASEFSDPVGSAEPLCCCEGCSWWLDSYPHLPNAQLRPLAPRNVKSSKDVINSSALRHNSVSSTSAHTRDLTERPKLKKCKTSSNNNTSIPINSGSCRPGERDRRLWQAGKEDDSRFPISVIVSPDDEEAYESSQRRLSISNRLRHKQFSYNYEAGTSSMKAPPNKSICHVMR